MTNKTLLLSFLILIIFSASCNKKIGDSVISTNEKIMLNALEQHNFNYTKYNAKADVDLVSGSFKMGIKAIIRVDDQGNAWFVGKKFGFEVGRAFITKDSIKILDRFNKRFAKKSINEINALDEFKDLLAEANNYLVGNIYIPENKKEFITSDQSTQIKIVDQKEYIYTINHIEQNLSNLKISDKDKHIEVKYLSYSTVEGKMVPNNYSISAYENNLLKASMDIKLSGIELNTNKGMPFNIPSNYTPFDI